MSEMDKALRELRIAAATLRATESNLRAAQTNKMNADMAAFDAEDTHRKAYECYERALGSLGWMVRGEGQ